MSKIIPFSNNTIKNSFGSYYREHNGEIVPRERCNVTDLENGLSVTNNDSQCLTKHETHRNYLHVPAYYQEDKLENINIGPVYYTTSGAGLPLTVIDLKNMDNYSYKTQVIINYIDNLITNKENNEISNVFFESVNTIKTLVSDVVSSTDNKKNKNLEFQVCEQDYCDAV